MKTLWRLSVETSNEAEDAVGELLQTNFGTSASSYTDVETGIATVSVFLAERPPSWVAVRRELRNALHQLRSCGLNTGLARILVRKIPRQDWAESWKRHFKPLVVGSTLLVKPSWSRRRPAKGQRTVVLDPGLSFGTGQHATTAFCLRELARLRHPSKSQSFLDAGTGSGILAIAAARLGYSPISAWDYDAEAVRTAEDNATRNRVAERINLCHCDVMALSIGAKEKFSLICANLISNVLLAARAALINRVQPGGWLVVAGILKEEFQSVQIAYENAGMKLVAKRTQREWTSGSFRKI